MSNKGREARILLVTGVKVSSVPKVTTRTVREKVFGLNTTTMVSYGEKVTTRTAGKTVLGFIPIQTGLFGRTSQEPTRTERRLVIK